MKKCFCSLSTFLCCLFVFTCFIFSSCSYKVYVVRHAEKSGSPANDPLLTVQGSQRAQDLKTMLHDKNIRRLYSTNTTRTMKTAEPLAEYLNLKIMSYPGKPDTSFIRAVKSFRKNQLIVGHSNTVDDIVNMLTGKALLSDLPDDAYNNLFVITIRRGRSRFLNLKYGRE